MEIKLSEILLVFSIIVFTLDTTYPPASFSSEADGFPVIEVLGLPSPIIFSTAVAAALFFYLDDAKLKALNKLVVVGEPFWLIG